MVNMNSKPDENNQTSEQMEEEIESVQETEPEEETDNSKVDLD